MQLPKEKSKPIDENPRFSILFGKPKSGKTTIVSALDDALIIDLEKGTSFIEAMKVEANNWGELIEVKKALHEQYTSNKKNPVYTYGVIDTATALEEIVMPYAISLYKETPMGTNFEGNDIRKLPNGAGYQMACTLLIAGRLSGNIC